MENNPVVELVPNLQLQLAINTAQIGRTFQDRTHIFQIHPRPENLPDASNLYNLGVRGRRGNIQQTFPAMEYDFSPTDLRVTSENYVHIQWEGSNTQPDTDGEGKAKTDRNNMVSIDASNWNIPQGQIVGEERNVTSEPPSSMFSNVKWIWSSMNSTTNNDPGF